MFVNLFMGHTQHAIHDDDYGRWEIHMNGHCQKKQQAEESANHKFDIFHTTIMISPPHLTDSWRCRKRHEQWRENIMFDNFIHVVLRIRVEIRIFPYCIVLLFCSLGCFIAIDKTRLLHTQQREVSRLKGLLSCVPFDDDKKHRMTWG